MTTTDLREVRDLAGADRRSARALAGAEAARIAAEQERLAADAAMERQLRAAEGRQRLAEQARAAQRTDQAENSAQRAAQRATRRAERKALADQRRAWVSARVDYARNNAPAVYSAGIYGMAVAGAVYGQVTAATGRGWPVVVGISIAAAIEGLALSMALTAHQLRLAGERATAPRVLTWACAGAAGTINYLGHAAQDQVGAVLLALLSVAGITVWEIRSGAKHRAELRRLGLLPDPPARFGWRRWVAFPLDTLSAWATDVRTRLGDDAAALVAARTAERRRRQVAGAARSAAAKCAGKGDAAGAHAALVRMAAALAVAPGPADAGPDRLAPGRTGGPAPAGPDGRTGAGAGGPAGPRTAGPAGGPAPGCPGGPAGAGVPGRADGPAAVGAPGWAAGGPGGLAAGPAGARSDGPTDARPYARPRVWEVSAPVSQAGGGAASMPTLPGPASPAPAVRAVVADRTAPVAPAVAAVGADRSAVDADPTAGPAADRTAPDVSGLLGPGRLVRDRLTGAGARLTRSALTAGLRQDGHTVSTERASALLAALTAEAGA